MSETERERESELIFSLRPASISDRFAMPDNGEEGKIRWKMKSNQRISHECRSSSSWFSSTRPTDLFEPQR